SSFRSRTLASTALHTTAPPLSHQTLASGLGGRQIRPPAATLASTSDRTPPLLPAPPCAARAPGRRARRRRPPGDHGVACLLEEEEPQIWVVEGLVGLGGRRRGGHGLGAGGAGRGRLPRPRLSVSVSSSPRSRRVLETAASSHSPSCDDDLRRRDPAARSEGSDTIVHGLVVRCSGQQGFIHNGRSLFEAPRAKWVVSVSCCKLFRLLLILLTGLFYLLIQEQMEATAYRKRARSKDCLAMDNLKKQERRSGECTWMSILEMT
ncbi:unnamed protein product, partial [Urochloa humidicola]